MKKHLLILLIALTNILYSKAQTEKELKTIAIQTNVQKTANNKDILTTFFRAGINNLLGKDHNFSFNSSFYGIDSIFKRKGKEISYEKERRLRQTSFNTSVTGDSVNNITTLAAGFTFTVINNKDIKLKKIKETDLDKLKQMSLFMIILKKTIIENIATNHKDDFINDSINSAINNSWNQADRKNDFSIVHPYIIEALNDSMLIINMQKNNEIKQVFSSTETKEIILSILNGEDRFHTVYKNIATAYARKPLWTFSPTYIYNKIKKQSEYAFASEFTVGLSKNIYKKPWEIEMKSALQIANDATLKNTNHENKPFFISLGVNKVLMENDERESKMEFKLFTQYDHQFGNVAPDKKQNIFTFNTTFRINVYKALWLPLTLKYNPENSNLFGFFSITANLGN